VFENNRGWGCFRTTETEGVENNRDWECWRTTEAEGVWEEQRLRVLENMVLRKVFRPKRKEVTGDWWKWLMRSSLKCTYHQILLGWSIPWGGDGWVVWHMWGNEKCIQGFCGEIWREESTWKTLSIAMKIILSGLQRNRLEKCLSLLGSLYGPMAGFCERGDEFSPSNQTHLIQNFLSFMFWQES